MPKRTPLPVIQHPATGEKSLRGIASGIAVEFLGSSLTVLSISAVRKLAEILLGGQLLWDVFPLRYCADTVDAAVFLRFIWQILKTFND